MVKVYYAVGHGVTPDGTFDPGARAGDWTEQNAGDVIVAEAVKVTAAVLGPENVYSEAYKNDPNFQGTPAAAERWGADIIVAVHHDWVRGIPAMFCFWDPDDTTGAKELSHDIRDAVIAAGFPHRADWHRERDNLGLLNGSVRRGITASLIEVNRVGSPDIDTDEERRTMGRAIARGVLTYLDKDAPTMSAQDVKKILERLDTIEGKVERGPRATWNVKLTNDVGGGTTTAARLLRRARLDTHELLRRDIAGALTPDDVRAIGEAVASGTVDELADAIAAVLGERLASDPTEDG